MLPQGMIYQPSALKAHVRVGHMFSFQPGSPGYSNIVSDLQRLPARPPAFQAKQFFSDVAYPYWQNPYHQGPYTQAAPHGFKRSLAQAGYVGAPLPSSDYNIPQITAYGPVYHVKRYGG